jgi:Arm DNA-binding domain
MKRLTAIAAKNLRPGTSRREIPDGALPGLFLVIQTSGVRSWALRLRRPDGRTAKVTLGRVDTANGELNGAPVIGQLLTLASARHLAAELLRDRALGRDVAADAVAAKRKKRTVNEEAFTNTFARAARDYVAYINKNRRRWHVVARLLGIDEKLEVVPKGLADRWRNKSIDTIDAADIYAVVDEVRHHGVPGRPRRADGPTEGMARSMHAVLRPCSLG